MVLGALTAHLFAPTNALALEEKTGNHTGEEKFLEYRIEYLSPRGVTIVNAGGITYRPFGFLSSHEDTVLPEQYFGHYPLYFANTILPFRVHIKNTGRRMYRNLQVITLQEFLNIEGLAGEAFPEPNTNTWMVEELAPGQERVLEGLSSIPNGPSGLDQTHLQIIHVNGGKESSGGEIIIDDPQAGIWCPLAPLTP